jgi:putative hydrolases of HD superfamily
VYPTPRIFLKKNAVKNCKEDMKSSEDFKRALKKENAVATANGNFIILSMALFLMSELENVRVFYKLKEVQRMSSVKDRKESPAEHTWSALILADYFITKFYEDKIDRLKVYELLMYHDIVEIESGDTPLSPNHDKSHQKELEQKSALKLSKKIPEVLSKKYLELFEEFESGTTIEARFAKAIEQLEAEIHEMDYKEDWKGWTEEFLRKHKQKYFKEFPEVEVFFEESIEYCRNNGYFDQ